MDLNSYLSSTHNLKWITDLTAKAEFIKLIKDNKGEYLHHLEAGKNILGKTHKASTIGNK